MKVQDIFGALIAAAAFFVLLFGFHWNALVAAAIAVGLYFAFALLLKPRRRIGNLVVDDLQNGEELQQIFEHAKQDLGVIDRSARSARNNRIRSGASKLVRTGSSLLNYLTQHVDLVPKARNFLHYYLDTAVEILGKYDSFCRSAIPDQDMARITANTISALDTLNKAFEDQYSHLLQGEVLDMEVDIDVLKNIAETDSGSPFRASSAVASGNAQAGNGPEADPFGNGSTDAPAGTLRFGNGPASDPPDPGTENRPA